MSSSAIAAAGERLIIRASAGTGKTFQLTNRYLRQLHSGATSDEILATTFTRKAAGEILERVMQRLALAASSDVAAADLAGHLAAPDFTRERALELLTDFTRALHRVHICTMDALFLRVASSMSLELGLMPGWTIIEQTEDAAIRDRAIDAMMQNANEGEIVDLTRLLSKNEVRQTVVYMIREAVKTVHELAQETTPQAWNWFPPIERMSDEQFEALLSVFPEIPVGSSRGERSHQTAVEDAANEDWGAFFARGLAPKILFENSIFSGKALPDECVAAYREMFRRAAPFYYDNVTVYTKATRRLADRFEQTYSDIKRRERGMMFNDVPRLLVKALSERETQRVAYRMNSSVKHVLLDEFQDTSLMQWHAIRSLVLGNKGSRLDSFFCVGDTKQAIYGWRGGIAEIFDAVPDEIPGIEEAPLNQSRRSWPAIVDTVNTLFNTLPTLNDLEEYEEPVRLWSERFTDHETAFASEPEANLRSYARLLVSEDPEPEVKREPSEKARVHQEFVAEEIVRLSEASPGRTIGVLTRTNRAASRLAFELRKRGIPASEEGGSAIADSAAVLAMLSLLHLTDHPGDTASRFHVASSPLGKVVGLQNFDSDFEAIKVARSIRRRLSESGYGQTMYELTEAIIDDCSMRDVVRLRQVIEMGWKFDADPSSRTRDFINLIESERVEAPTEDRVRVMTVHKSKGLEFDIVVLPELNHQSSWKRVAWAASDMTEAPDRVCMHVKRAAQEILPPEFRELFRQTTNRDVIESLCLLYVAITRAAHALHMIIEPDPKDFTRKRKGNVKWYTKYAGLLQATLATTATAEQGVTLFERGNPDWHAVDRKYRTAEAPPQSDKRVRPVSGLKLAPMTGGRRRGLQPKAPSIHRSRAIKVGRLMTSRGNMAMLRGSAVHKWFEQIEWLDDELPGDDQFRDALDRPEYADLEIDDLLTHFRKVLEARSVIKALSRSGYATRSVFPSALSKRLRNGELHLEVYRERQFAMHRDGELISGTIDRLVLLMDGSTPVAADIIDFKTDQAKNQRKLKSLVDVYAEQLEVYQEAVAHMFRLDDDVISARLLMTEAGMVLDV